MHELTTSDLVVLLGVFTAFGASIGIAFSGSSLQWSSRRRYRKWLKSQTQGDKK